MPDWTPRDTARARQLRNAATPAERALWRYLARGQLGTKFSRQMPVGPFFADFLCRELHLIVELDGHSHDIAPEADTRRDAFLDAEGYRTMRFTNADVLADPEAVATAIRTEIERLAAPTPNPSRLREGTGVGKALKTMPDWTPRDTARARQLRNAATPAERALWRYLARGQLGAKFSRQMPVGPFFADFLCRELRLIVELDGHSHDIAPEADTSRDAYLDAEGYRTMRFTNADVLADPEAVATAIRTEIERLAAPTPNPSRKREGS